MKQLTFALALGLASALPVHAEPTADLFVSINSGVTQTQGVGVAKPADVAAYLLQSNVKSLSY